MRELRRAKQHESFAAEEAVAAYPVQSPASSPPHPADMGRHEQEVSNRVAALSPVEVRQHLEAAAARLELEITGLQEQLGYLGKAR